ncbi:MULTISPECIES: sugar phosphate isomerase/epimerase [Rhizobium/Agrobacterium group]|uniref:Sugar phosphate isomerase/epimerase n=1 Tax=Rhizobium rhizogenes TaxID=359 RepID=A0A546XAZ8_RHIRH|nr:MULTISPECIES: TIM barrel protein [Rhizobium/Agrobacterium group]TRA97934.1 sugar phosphate isomerase/epimerase [Rhizobium rhizogenes]
MNGSNYCFSTLGCSELSLHEAAYLAERHGITSVELRALSGTIDLIAALVAEFGTPARFAAFLTERNIRIAALNTSMRLFGSSSLSELAPFIDWAEAANIAYLRIFDGGKKIGAEELDSAAALLDEWQGLRQSRGLNVELMIETHDALADFDQLLAFLEYVPTARILWDTHHTWARGSDLKTLWHQIAKNVVHLHVKDSTTDRDGKRRYVLPGQGDFPIEELLSLLQPDERKIPLSLEWERHWHPQLPPLEDALKAARHWWRQGVS